MLLVLEGLRQPATLSWIARQITLTRHESRVRLALESLESQGIARFTGEGGWMLDHRTPCPGLTRSPEDRQARRAGA